MLDSLRTCDGAVLGNMAYHDDCNVIRLRYTDEACGNFPDLGNAARCSRNLLGIKCLNGIDYRKAGLVSLELFCYSFESRLSADEDIALYLKSGCAHSDLGR